MNQEILKQCKGVKSPTVHDVIVIEGHKFSMKKIKQYLNLLKNHSYSFSFENGNLHLNYSNKNSVGIAKFYGSLLVLVLLTSCSTGYYSYTDGNWHPDVYKESQIVCPKDYVYNKYSEKCHYSIPPIPSQTSLSPELAIIKPEIRHNKPKAVKRLKKDNEATLCSKAIYTVKQCGVNI